MDERPLKSPIPHQIIVSGVVVAKKCALSRLSLRFMHAGMAPRASAAVKLTHERAAFVMCVCLWGLSTGGKFFQFFVFHLDRITEFRFCKPDNAPF
jgi:hypothetical protein